MKIHAWFLGCTPTDRRAFPPLTRQHRMNCAPRAGTRYRGADRPTILNLIRERQDSTNKGLTAHAPTVSLIWLRGTIAGRDSVLITTINIVFASSLRSQPGGSSFFGRNCSRAENCDVRQNSNQSLSKAMANGAPTRPRGNNSIKTR